MKKKISILLLAFVGCVMLMGASSYVNLGLRKMMDVYGKFKEIHWSNGQITRYEDIGSGGYGTGSVFNLAGGTITGNLAVTGNISGDGSQLTGVIADGMNGTVFVGTDTFRFVPGAGKNFIVETSETGSVKINNGTVSATINLQGYVVINPGTATGANYITIGTATIPAKALGQKGWLETTLIFTKSGTISAGDVKVLFYDGVGTTTETKSTLLAASNQSLRWFFDLYNRGSATSNLLTTNYSGAYSTSSGLTSTDPVSINTNNTVTVYIQGSCTAHNLVLEAGNIKYYYAD